MLIEAVYGANWREKMNSTTVQPPLSENSSSEDENNKTATAANSKNFTTFGRVNKNRSMLIPSNVLYLTSEGEEEE